MDKEQLSKELGEHASKIGHNLGPPLIEKEEELRDVARKRLSPESEFKRFEILLDMMKSHVNGERLLPKTSAAYVTIALSSVAWYTGVGMAVAPLPTALADIAVLGLVYATLRGEIDDYIVWRAQRDPDYGKGL